MTDEPRNKRNKTVFQDSPLSGLKRQDQASRSGYGEGSQGTSDYDPWGADVYARPDEGIRQEAPGSDRQREHARSAGIAPSRLTEDDVPVPAEPLKVRNVMLNEARPVLALFASLHAGRIDAKLPRLNREAKQSVRDFERAIQLHYPDEKTRYAAKYALCVTIDDLAQNLPGRENDGHAWAQRSVAIEHFRDRDGGRRFWRIVDDILIDPVHNRDLIELYHTCLAAGFMGEYREDARNGVPPSMRAVMTRLYGALEHPRSISQTELVREWEGVDAPAGKPALWSIVMLAAAAVTALLLLIYLILRLILASTGAAPGDALEGLVPAEPGLTMSREGAPPPVAQGAQATELEKILAQEIAQGLVVVEQDAETVRIRTTDGELFRSGSDVLEPARVALFDRIAQALEKQQGYILVEGHSDSDKIAASFRFPDNQALSEARAHTVGLLLAERLSDSTRVRIEGFGDARRIESNDTAEGKALNRRVEIIIPRVR